MPALTAGVDAETRRQAEAYEAAVMARRPGDPGPETEPPEGYEMSPRFQKWLVERMRDEVFGEDGGMAVLDGRMLQRGAVAGRSEEGTGP